MTYEEKKRPAPGPPYPGQVPGPRRDAGAQPPAAAWVSVPPYPEQIPVPPSSPAKIEAQRSGFDFERRSSGANELSARLPEANDTELAPTPERVSFDDAALYARYMDRYLQNARRAMQDTAGMAASLTGGYGNTYAQSVGQQAYDETLRGLTDLIPQLERDADERRQRGWSRLSGLILTTGYAPDPEELEAAGMSQAQAEALRQAWIASDPASAWMQGAVTADRYLMLTGRLPSSAPGSGRSGSGGGGGGGGGGRRSAAKSPVPGDKDAGDGAVTEDEDFLNYLSLLGLR